MVIGIILGEIQGGFQTGQTDGGQHFTLQGICALRKSKKDRSFLAFLNLSKVFDRVWRKVYFTYYGKMVFSVNVVNS